MVLNHDDREVIDHFSIPDEYAADFLAVDEEDEDEDEEYLDRLEEEASLAGGDLEEQDVEESSGDDGDEDCDHEAYRTKMRVHANDVFEKQRRKGGRVTQAAVKRCMQVCVIFFVFRPGTD